MQPLSPPITQEEIDKNITTHKMNCALRQLYPHIRERDNVICLPRKWDISQASSYLELSPNGLTVTFKRNASIQGDKDPSGVVRADSYIPASAGVYYFEVRILHGHRGCMGVGLSKQGGELNRMPGWDANCFGYHGDDGNFFSACGHGIAYGPKFGTGDVIGCGIDTVLNQVFFTKNGKHLGVAYQGDIPLEELYPTVGLKTPGERLHVNFGQSKFMFDFDAYRDTLNNKKIHKLEDVKMPDEIGRYMDRVVISFLGHSGALETLKAFEKVAKVDRTIDHEFLRKRKEIVEMVLNATHGALIQEHIEKHFPGCIERDNKVHLILLCLRYIDLANTMQKPPPSFKSSLNEHGRSISPTEIRSRPPKLLKGSHCKSTKRTREAARKNTNCQVHTPPPVRRTNAKAAEELCLKNSKIDKFFTDEDTGEEMLSIDGLTITKRMYVELYNSEEYRKLAYIIKMGREIMSLASKVESQLNAKDRQILEISMTMVLSHNPLEKHPLNASHRRYIANSMIEMINSYSTLDALKTKPETSTSSVITKEQRVYSELRGMFLGWQGLHYDTASRDHRAASIHFMKHMVLEKLSFKEKEIAYSDEPMEEEDGTAEITDTDNGMVVEEDEEEEVDDEEEDV